MKANEAIRTVMARKGIRMKDICDSLELTSSALANQLNGERNLSLEKIDNILMEIGYKIMFVPNDVQVIDGWYEVTSNSLDGCERKAVVEEKKESERAEEMDTDMRMKEMFSEFQKWYEAMQKGGTPGGEGK